MASIKILFGGEQVKVYRLDKSEVCVGRDEACEVHIDNLGISRRHCQFENTAGVYQVRDLNSSNGTFVNGKKITQHSLQNNDQVLIGKYTMIFLDDGADPAVATSTAAGEPGSSSGASGGIGGGFDQMHTYVMDGAQIRERLLQGDEGAAKPKQPTVPVVAPGGGATKTILIMALITLLLLVVVVLVLLLTLLKDPGKPANEGAPASQPSTNAAPETAPTETKEDIDKPTAVMPPTN